MGKKDTFDPDESWSYWDFYFGRSDVPLIHHERFDAVKKINTEEFTIDIELPKTDS